MRSDALAQPSLDATTTLTLIVAATILVAFCRDGDSALSVQRVSGCQPFVLECPPDPKSLRDVVHAHGRRLGGFRATTLA